MPKKILMREEGKDDGNGDKGAVVVEVEQMTRLAEGDHERV